jgi:hypothetical protein
MPACGSIWLALAGRTSKEIRGRIGQGGKYGMARLKDPEMLFKDAVPWYQQECQKSRRR